MIVDDNVFGPSIAKSAGVVFNPYGDRVIVRLTPEGILRGGVVFTNYTGRGNSIGLHFAGYDPRWMSKRLISIVFHYAFCQLAVGAVFVQIRETNTVALEIARKIGFKERAQLADVIADEALVVLAMRRDECRWIE